MIRKMTFGIVAFYSFNSVAAPTVLKVEQVIQAVTTQGLQQKDIQLGYQKSDLGLLMAESNFDTQMYAKAQNEDSRAEAPGLFSNKRDQSKIFAFGLSRKFTTGSTLGLDYSYLHKDIDLNPNAAQFGMPAVQYYHLTTLSFKQDLLNNAFGYKDSRQYHSAELQKERAHFERDEASEELVLQTIKLYLDTYFAQESLKQSVAARDKYLLLVKSVQQKSRMGFDDRSELVKTKAELQNQERNLKTATLMYNTLVDKLYMMMNAERPQDLTLEVPEIAAPASTAGSAVNIDQLRKSQSSHLLVEATSAEKEASENNQRASLNFFAQAAYSGLDAENDPALKEMRSRDYPKYTVGLEFGMRWGSSAQKADQISKTIAREEAINSQSKIKNDLTETLDRTDKQLQAKYFIALNAQETVKMWEEAVKSQERNHKFSRITTAELIMDYGSYFRAKSALSGAIADYHLALFEYQATRDQLIK